MDGLLSARTKRSHTSRGSTLDLPTLGAARLDTRYDRFQSANYRRQVALRWPRLLQAYRALELALGGGNARRAWIRARWLGFRLRDARAWMRGLWRGR